MLTDAQADKLWQLLCEADEGKKFKAERGRRKPPSPPLPMKIPADRLESVKKNVLAYYVTLETAGERSAFSQRCKANGLPLPSAIYREVNREQIAAETKAYNKAYREANPTDPAARRAYERLQRELYPHKHRARNRSRQASRVSQTPPWADRKEMERIYADCPKGHDVDHIIPLRGVTPAGDLVSGLHVPWNLQYLRPEHNKQKKNRMTEDDWTLCCEAGPRKA
jgi:hypothetical protein